MREEGHEWMRVMDDGRRRSSQAWIRTLLDDGACVCRHVITSDIDGGCKSD